MQPSTTPGRLSSSTLPPLSKSHTGQQKQAKAGQAKPGKGKPGKGKAADDASQASSSICSQANPTFPVKLSTKYKDILTPTHSWPLFDAFTSSLPSQLAFQEHTISSAFMKPVSYLQYNQKFGEYQVVKSENQAPLTNIIYSNTPSTLHGNQRIYQQQALQQTQSHRTKFLSSSASMIREVDKAKKIKENPPIQVPLVLVLLMDMQDEVSGGFPCVDELLERLGLPDALDIPHQWKIEYKNNLGPAVALSIYKQHKDFFDLLYDSYSLGEKWLPPKNITLKIQKQLIDLFLFPSKYEERLAALNQGGFDLDDSLSQISENGGMSYQFQLSKEHFPQADNQSSNVALDAQSVDSLSTMESPSVLAMPHMHHTFNAGPKDLQYMANEEDDLHALFADRLKEIQEIANKEQKELQIKSLKLQTGPSSTTDTFDATNPSDTFHLLSPIPGSPSNYAPTPVSGPDTNKAKLQASSSFSLLNSTLNDLTAYDVDLIELDKQKKLIEFYESEVVRLIMSIEEELPKVSDALQQCVTRYNNSDLLTEKYKQFDMLMYSVSEGFDPEPTFDDWRKYGVKSIRNLVILYLNALHSLAFARHRLNVLDPQNKYHQSAYQEQEEEEDEEDLDQLRFTAQPSAKNVSLDTTLILKGEIDKVKKKQFKRLKDNWTLLWGGKNSALKVSHSLDFLRKSRELSEWWGLAFYFVSNPLFFPFPMTEAFELSRMSEYVDALLTYMAQGGTTLSSEELLDNFHENYDSEDVEGQYEPWRIADPYSYAHLHFFSEWKRKFFNKFKDCASNWPKPPDIRDNEVALSVFNCIVVLYITCEQSIIRSFKWERQFIADISSTRGQETYLVGHGNPKRDRVLYIPPVESRTNYRPPVRGLSNKKFNNNSSRRTSVSTTNSSRRRSIDHKSEENSEDDEFDAEPEPGPDPVSGLGPDPLPSQQAKIEIEEDDEDVEETKPEQNQQVSKEKVKRFANILKSSGGILTSRRGLKPQVKEEEAPEVKNQGRLTKMSNQRTSVLTKNAINNLKNKPGTFLLPKILDDDESVESTKNDTKGNNSQAQAQTTPTKKRTSVLVKSASQPQMGSPNKRNSVLRPLSSDGPRASILSKTPSASVASSASAIKKRKSILSPLKENKSQTGGQRKSIVPPPPSVLKMGDSKDIGNTSLSVLNTHIEEEEEEDDDEEEAAIIAARKEKFRLQQLQNANPLVSSNRKKPNSRGRDSVLASANRRTTVKK